jgi:hypothetical protein
MTNKLKASLLEKLERLKGNSPSKGLAGQKPIETDEKDSFETVAELPAGKVEPDADLRRSAVPEGNLTPGGHPIKGDSPRKEERKEDTALDEMIHRIRGLAAIAPQETDQTACDDFVSETEEFPEEEGASVEDIVRRVAGGATESASEPTPGPFPLPNEPPAFFPIEPDTLQQAGLNESAVEELILKCLLTMGEETGHEISNQIKLPFKLVTPIISRMKYDQLVAYRSTTKLNDYVCTLTDAGRERARRHSDRCTYFGAAPVSLAMYRESVAKQSLQHQHPSEADLRRAFSDLMINPVMIMRLGAAMNSGKGMFLFGGPGNGKTSIAERVTKAFGEAIWVPRAIGIDGEIVRLFDPTQHEVMPLPPGDDFVKAHKIDARWVRIRRPTIIVGGELTMSNLELSTNTSTGINEAPVQLKSNCGTLVIDDFGRQRMSVTELLNRWIVPLEKRIDYLNLPSGKKIQVPFDQLVVFSTNLEPRDLVDDAFLRRIPYKIEVSNPTEEEFRKLFAIMCEKMKVPANPGALDYLINTHYKPKNRPFRCCHPRDLLLQIQSITSFQQQPLAITEANFDLAADSYFSVV